MKIFLTDNYITNFMEWKFSFCCIDDTDYAHRESGNAWLNFKIMDWGYSIAGEIYVA